MQKESKKLLYGQSVIVDLPTKTNRKHTDYYKKWYDVFRRCYDPKCQKKRPTYIGCSVSEEWHTLSTFKDWYYSQPTYGKSGMALDKDILVRGNKVYGPNTCRLVPQRVNSLLVDCKAARGTYPVGVSFNKRKNKYQSKCSNGSKSNSLGYYETIEEAFATYKTYKESLIKTVAEDYYSQNLITSDVRFALVNWTITR